MYVVHHKLGVTSTKRFHLVLFPNNQLQAIHLSCHATFNSQQQSCHIFFLHQGLPPIEKNALLISLKNSAASSVMTHV